MAADASIASGMFIVFSLVEFLTCLVLKCRIDRVLRVELFCARLVRFLRLLARLVSALSGALFACVTTAERRAHCVPPSYWFLVQIPWMINSHAANLLSLL